MGEPLVILGTHWLAEEYMDLISEMPEWEVTAFVENMDPSRCNMEIEGLPVVWVDDLADMVSTHHAICALGTTHRSRFVEQVKAMGMPFATLVHPTARVSPRAVIGTGCFISAQCAVSTSAVIGDHVFVNRGALIGHHTRIGDYCSILPGANIAGLCTVGDRSYVAMGAVVLDRISVGSGSVIGAGAVVTRDVPDHAEVVGVPARVVKTMVEGK